MKEPLGKILHSFLRGFVGLLSHSFGLFSIIDNNAAFTHHAIEWRELRRLEQAFFAP
jgi:hypothetical protein